MKHLLILFFLVLSLRIQAQNFITLSGEQFNFQETSQKFEFQTLSNHILQIENFIYDTEKISAVISQKNKNNFTIKFTLPLDLKSSEVFIANNIGKKIISYSVDQLKLSPQILTIESNLKYKVLTTEEILLSKNIIESIVSLPFFKICQNKIAEKSQIEICTSDLYVDPQSYTIQAREEINQKEFIQINNLDFESSGALVLNSFENPIKFRFESKNGASLVILTTKAPISNLDVTLSKKNEIQFIYKGSQPTNTYKYKKLNSNLFAINLTSERPYFHLFFDQIVPIRVEFSSSTEIPSGSLRVKLNTPIPEYVYSKYFTANITIPPQFNLEDKNEKIQIVDESNNNKTLKLGPLENGENKFVLNLLSPKKQNLRQTITIQKKPALSYHLGLNTSSINSLGVEFDATLLSTYPLFLASQWINKTFYYIRASSSVLSKNKNTSLQTLSAAYLMNSASFETSTPQFNAGIGLGLIQQKTNNHSELATNLLLQFEFQFTQINSEFYSVKLIEQLPISKKYLKNALSIELVSHKLVSSTGIRYSSLTSELKNSAQNEFSLFYLFSFK